MTQLPPLPSGENLKRSERLYEWYKTLIEYWDMAEPLPSQNIVMKETGVSLVTVTTALKRLEEEGLIRRYRGKGTFITQKNIPKYSEKKPTKKSKKILLVYLDSPSEVLWSKIHYCEELIAKNGCDTIQFKLHNNFKLDGIIKITRSDSSIIGMVFSTTIKWTAATLEQLNALEIPVAIMEPVSLPTAPLKNLYITHPDYFQSGYTMAEYLLRLKHRKIGYIQDVLEPVVCRLHQEGIEAALKEAKIPRTELRILNDWHRLGESVGDVALRLTKTMLSENLDITAIIYDTGVGAHAGILAVNQLGKSVPDDISVIGEGDYSYMRVAAPPVTVTSYDLRTRARLAIQSILNKEKKSSLIPVVLIARESVCGAMSVSNSN